MLTIFTAPKPFVDRHIDMIQRNAIRSWLSLGPEVEALLVGDELGMAEAAGELGVRMLSDVRRNAEGTPLVSAIFDSARAASASPLLACVNTDVVLLPDFFETARALASQLERFLVVGQRWDLDVRAPLDFGAGWAERMRGVLAINGRLHPPGGSDYFVFPRSQFRELPDFAIGRAGWDNWMIYHARRQGWPVVDASGAVTAIHQDHDYRHLPDGQPHYRLPESQENLRLAGGRRAVFSLVDADYRFQEEKVWRQPRSWARFWRSVETYPMLRLQSSWLAQLVFTALHPGKGWGELRGWAKYKWSRLARARPGAAGGSNQESG